MKSKGAVSISISISKFAMGDEKGHFKTCICKFMKS